METICMNHTFEHPSDEFMLVHRSSSFIKGTQRSQLRQQLRKLIPLASALIAGLSHFFQDMSFLRRMFRKPSFIGAQFNIFPEITFFKFFYLFVHLVELCSLYGKYSFIIRKRTF